MSSSISLWVPKLWRFNPGAAFSPKFLALPGGEIYIGSEKNFRDAKWYRHPDYGGAETLVPPKEERAKMFDACFVVRHASE